jgi:hypothetical protein
MGSLTGEAAIDHEFVEVDAYWVAKTPVLDLRLRF